MKKATPANATQLPVFPRPTFLLSVANLPQLPPDQGIEIAFAGRSNAGKSSAINIITGVKKLAHVSKTPGRTQCLNFFTIDDKHHLVDLPGYGYAKVSIEVKARWNKLLEQYLVKRECLQGLVLVMDVRHPLKEFDQQMLQWAEKKPCPVYLLLTKADKLSRSAAMQTLRAVDKATANFSNIAGIQLFSSLNNLGLLEARQHLLKWFGIDK